MPIRVFVFLILDVLVFSFTFIDIFFELGSISQNQLFRQIV